MKPLAPVSATSMTSIVGNANAKARSPQRKQGNAIKRAFPDVARAPRPCILARESMGGAPMPRILKPLRLRSLVAAHRVKSVDRQPRPDEREACEVPSRERLVEGEDGQQELTRR